MKTVLSIAGHDYALPQKDAINVMNAMSKAIRLRHAFEGTFKKQAGDYRTHYLADAHPEKIQICQVDDDQIHIPEGSPTEPESTTRRRPKALVQPISHHLGFGGGQ